MRTTIKRVPVWELPPRLREGRKEADFVDLVIEDVTPPSDSEKLALLRSVIDEADEDVRHGRVRAAEDVFAELRAGVGSGKP